MPFEPSKAFFFCPFGLFLQGKTASRKKRIRHESFFAPSSKRVLKKRYKEIGMVLWYTVSIKTAAATNCADRFNVKKPQ